jgi:hypothetical protein
VAGIKLPVFQGCPHAVVAGYAFNEIPAPIYIELQDIGVQYFQQA